VMCPVMLYETCLFIIIYWWVSLWYWSEIWSFSNTVPCLFLHVVVVSRNISPLKLLFLVVLFFRLSDITEIIEMACSMLEQMHQLRQKSGMRREVKLHNLIVALSTFRKTEKKLLTWVAWGSSGCLSLILLTISILNGASVGSIMSWKSSCFAGH
jgi:hypothetical protein